MTATDRTGPPSASESETNAPTAVQKNLVIVGATGMVGAYALRYALDHPAVGRTTTIGRRKVGISHPKLNEVIHQDFANCSALAQVLTDQQAAIFCLGAYTGAVSDTELRAITVDYTIEFARVLHGGSPDAVFAFLSGSGADPTGRSRMSFARYKGEAENALLARGFASVYVFRPAYIYPVTPRRERNSAIACCARSTLRFGCYFPARSFEPTTWPELWWMSRCGKQGNVEGSFSRTATSKPLSSSGCA